MRKFFLLLVLFVLAGSISIIASNKKVIIKNVDIVAMVKLCVENNGIINPDIIQPGFNPIWQFPDNNKFQFYDLDPIQQGGSLSRTARHLLLITADYHKNNKISDWQSKQDSLENVELYKIELIEQQKRDSISNVVEKQRLDKVAKDLYADQYNKPLLINLGIIIFVVLIGVCLTFWVLSILPAKKEVIKKRFSFNK